MMIAYKAFEPDLSCTSGGNRFQYDEKEWNEEPEANCAKNGFHCASNPLDCLTYYPAWDSAVYYMVLVDGDINEDGLDSKISCTRMKLLKKLTLKEFVSESIMYMCDHPQLKTNGMVQENTGEARQHFTIVRGKKPVAKGRLGSILGFAQEAKNSREIVQAGILVVDGENVLPDTWYTLDGKIAERLVAEL